MRIPAAFLAAALLLSAACATTTGPASEPVPEDPGRSLYRAKCHSCHRLYSPQRFSAEKWPAIVDKMAVKAKLTDDEKERILAYLLAGAARK